MPALALAKGLPRSVFCLREWPKVAKNMTSMYNTSPKQSPNIDRTVSLMRSLDSSEWGDKDGIHNFHQKHLFFYAMILLQQYFNKFMF